MALSNDGGDPDTRGMGSSGTVRVDHKEGDLFEIAVRQHLLHVDQPVESGGTDAAPTPTELLVASLASCVAFYVRRFLSRHRLPVTGLSVSIEFTTAERPARIDQMHVSIGLPHGVPAGRHAALLAVASHCAVHTTLQVPPSVQFALVA